jgi:hypothetical protein
MAKKKTILVFTENKKEETNISNYFRASDCSIKVAKEMHDFRHFIKNNLIDFVLVDSSVEKYSSEIIKLLDSAKVGYAFLADDSSNSNLFTNVWKKPYSFRSLVSMMEEKIGEKLSLNEDQAEQYLNAVQYVSIKIEDVIHSKKAPYDYFVKINDTKYVRIAKEGNTVAVQILHNIQAKGVQIVYAKREDYAKYLDVRTQTAVNMKVPKDVKMKFLTKTSELIMDQIYTDGVSKEMLFSSKQVLDSSMSLALEDDNMFNLISMLNDIDQSVYRHSLAVSIYSVLIAKQLNWETESTIFKLSLGAIFSDIGLRAINPEILKKSHTFLSEEESIEYQRHPILGADMMRGVLPGDDIIDIIMQHHENCDGSGYPRGLNRNTIHPLAKVVRVAHEFCELALKTENNPSPEAPLFILSNLIMTASKKLDMGMMQALAKSHGLDLSNLSAA